MCFICIACLFYPRPVLLYQQIYHYGMCACLLQSQRLYVLDSLVMTNKIILTLSSTLCERFNIIYYKALLCWKILNVFQYYWNKVSDLYYLQN